jgi:hypothetical protein
MKLNTLDLNCLGFDFTQFKVFHTPQPLLLLILSYLKLTISNIIKVIGIIQRN